jgi:hypothetical protein
MAVINQAHASAAFTFWIKLPRTFWDCTRIVKSATGIIQFCNGTGTAYRSAYRYWYSVPECIPVLVQRTGVHNGTGTVYRSAYRYWYSVPEYITVQVQRTGVYPATLQSSYLVDKLRASWEIYSVTARPRPTNIPLRKLKHYILAQKCD